MPETRLIINGPEVENTGPTNRSVDFDSENKSLETDSTRNTPEDMGFEEKDEVKKHLKEQNMHVTALP